MTCSRYTKSILVVLDFLFVVSLAVFAQNSTRPASRVAYVHDNSVWIKDLPASEPIQVLATTATDLKWSASGSWLALRAPDKTVVISADGRRQFPNLSDTFSWSPVKDELAFRVVDGVHIDRFNSDGPQARIIMRQPNVGGFTWSHNGSSLAVTVMVNRTAHLWIANDDGSPAHEIPVYKSDSSEIDLGEATLAGWSGDDTWIFVWPNAAHSASLAADGFGLIAVPRNGGRTRFLSDIFKTDVLLYNDYVAFARHRSGVVLTAGGDREAWTNKRVTFVDPDSGKFAILTDTKTAAGSVDWSPDGSRIAFPLGPDAGSIGGGEQAKNALAQRRIWVINVDGRQPRQLTSDPEYRDEYPLWSHDGRTILFARIDRQDNVSVWTIDVAGGNLQKVVDALADPVDKDLWFSYYGHINWSSILAWTR
jgi:hypothetical protein